MTVFESIMRGAKQALAHARGEDVGAVTHVTLSQPYKIGSKIADVGTVIAVREVKFQAFPPDGAWYVGYEHTCKREPHCNYCWYVG